VCVHINFFLNKSLICTFVYGKNRIYWYLYYNFLYCICSDR